jgi:hypothetical protein
MVCVDGSGVLFGRKTLVGNLNSETGYNIVRLLRCGPLRYRESREQGVSQPT